MHKFIQKANGRYIISEGLLSVLKTLVTGNSGINIEDIKKQDPKTASELSKALQDIEKWADKPHPEGGTWGDYVSKRAKSKRDKYNI
jgi:hypothetical protein